MRPHQKTIPVSSTPALGNPVREYSLHRKQLTHWGLAFLAALLILGALLNLGAGLYLTYEHYYRNGPAVVGKDLVLPVAGSAVLLVLGLWVSVTAYRLWNVAVTVFDTGFVSRNHRGEQNWRWEEIAGMRVGIFAPFTKGINFQKKYAAVLKKSTGELLNVSGPLENMQELIDEIRRHVLPRLCGEAFEALGSGKNCRYGPVEVSSKDGLRVGKNSLTWEEMQSIDVENGSLVFRIGKPGNKNNHQIKVPVHEVENLEVLLTVVEHYRADLSG